MPESLRTERDLPDTGLKDRKGGAGPDGLPPCFFDLHAFFCLRRVRFFVFSRSPPEAPAVFEAYGPEFGR